MGNCARPWGLTENHLFSWQMPCHSANLTGDNADETLHHISFLTSSELVSVSVLLLLFSVPVISNCGGRRPTDDLSHDRSICKAVTLYVIPAYVTERHLKSPEQERETQTERE